MDGRNVPLPVKLPNVSSRSWEMFESIFPLKKIFADVGE
jgi:hypothetical protein